jgi:hypothetical protein
MTPNDLRGSHSAPQTPRPSSRTAIHGLDGDSSGLHAIWRMGHTDDMAALRLLVLAAFAFLLIRVAIRAFSRSATA